MDLQTAHLIQLFDPIIIQALQYTTHCILANTLYLKCMHVVVGRNSRMPCAYIVLDSSSHTIRILVLFDNKLTWFIYLYRHKKI